LRRPEDLDGFDTIIERAIERGARERDRSEFLATIGHELRTPLTSIRGYVETVLDDDVDPATARRFLEIVRSETLRLGRLVEGMLEFSLLDLTADARVGVCDLASTIRAAVDALAPVAAQAGVAVHARHEPETLARVGSDACMHALLNILENAVKYGRAGGRVFVYVERDACGLCVVVDDDGPGIEPAERERIFEHGARGARAGERTGNGLGLSIVRTLVERAGGCVSAASSPLGGARFVVRFARATNVRAELAALMS
jgi:two-component system phosphate regulon sensor histidine kinase PhoR